MSQNVYLELDQKAQEMVHRLGPLFGTMGLAATVARALSLADVAAEFVDGSGNLTIVDPQVSAGPDEDRFVDIRVNAHKEPPAPEARAA